MKHATNLEHRASSSRSKHEGESSLGLCDRLDRTRDNSQRQLPTDHDYAVPTREYQTDQSSLKSAPAAARSVFGKQQKQRQKTNPPIAQVDTVTPYQASYLYDRNDPAHRGYAIVAFLPNLSGAGNVRVVQGFTLAGTQAAADFVTNDHDFDQLFAPIIAKRRGLPHFEVLLKTMDVNGLGARPSVLTYRVY